MIFIWLASSFTYFMISYQLKYIPGDLYTNGMISSVSEVAAYVLSGLIYQKLGLKPTLIACFLFSMIGMLLILFV